ncbi:MAG TPA: hypothetical protein VNW92_28485 [Polyangiaceae bacterium]|jgi:hypothetical protein|nr:hypothetical protein [Polyangiaceae bacterium]
MTTQAQGCADRSASALIDRHFAGQTSVTGERQLRLHLAGCASCRQQYDQYLLLSKIDPDSKKSRERLARGLGLAEDAPKWSVRFAPLAMAFAMVAVLVVGFGALRRGHRQEFAVRGVTSNKPAPQLFIYGVKAERAPERLQHILSASDEVAFAYVNPGNFRKLLIFGIDEHRHVYWYYPAWTNESENPHGVDAAGGDTVHELPESIGHSLDGGELTVIALFTDQDLSVRDIERMLAEQSRTGAPSFAQLGVEQRFQFTVQH